MPFTNAISTPNYLDKSQFIDDLNVEDQTAEFNNSRYIKYLNKCMIATLNTLRAYSVILEEETLYHEICLGHQRSCKIIQNLIITNSGIANSNSDITGELSRAIIQLTNIFPKRLHTHTSTTAIIMIEKNLAGLYKNLLALAPKKDKIHVYTLYREALKHVEQLR